jgi:hypothetical protein
LILGGAEVANFERILILQPTVLTRHTERGPSSARSTTKAKRALKTFDADCVFNALRAVDGQRSDGSVRQV